MSYIKKIFNRQNIKPILIVILVLTSLILEFVSGNLASQLAPQKLVDRWQSDEKYAQISVFFKEGFEPDGNMALQYRAMMHEALKDAAVDTDKKSARVLIDAYSTQTTLTISSEKNDTTVRAFGVSKDYFIFHPEKLLSGNYFSYNDENTDGIILDENTAWTLFGARNVAGMYVDIGGRACVIRGVVKCEEGLFSKASEEELPKVYVDFDLLSSLQGESMGEDGMEVETPGTTISCYELLVQNPVRDFGKDKLKEIIGLEDGQYEIIENSSRFNLKSRFLRIGQLGKRSMNIYGVTYPFWENRARAYEDITTYILILQIICLLYPAFIVLKAVFKWLRHKKYKAIIDTIKNIIKKLYLDGYKARKN